MSRLGGVMGSWEAWLGEGSQGTTAGPNLDSSPLPAQTEPK